MWIGLLKSSRPVLVLVAVTIAIIAGACAPASSTAGDTAAPEQEVIESSTPIPTLSTADIRELLKEATPGFDDLPIGFSLVEELFIANEEAARDALEGQATALDNYDLWGRVMGYIAVYEETSGISVLVGAEYYRSASGAESAFDWLPPNMSQEQYIANSLVASFEGELGITTSIETTRISFPRLGDQSAAYEVRASVFLSQFTMYAVGIRVGNLTGATFVLVPPPDLFLAEESRPVLEILEIVARSIERKLTAATD